ncbi:hypothetical protein PR202_gb15488 [Eleusine coracana subsp. coracana]|uniref:Uncharacterized protein n=1 Tax=Eleusine coracana subsp. coracana TaxID=191504 RepID=A0AAV5EZ17_ELECO|nr:hypothetical protein PR202_gb15488 [Eleusine coracana subsp. coracana]
MPKRKLGRGRPPSADSTTEVTVLVGVSKENKGEEDITQPHNSAKVDKWSVSDDNKLKFSVRIAHFLLPWLKEFHQEQMQEKDIEASSRGVDACEVVVPQVDCPGDTRMYCNKCKTSIVDFHRSCKKCSYDLCLSCCHELRQGPNSGDVTKLGGKGVSKQRYNRNQVARQESSDKQNCILLDSAVSCKPSSRRWRLNNDGSIPCPPKSSGGCGNSLLELKCLFKKEFVSELLEKVNSVINSTNIPELVGSKCSCFTGSGDVSNEMSRESASRKNSGDNHIYCPTARDVEDRDLDHFQKHWIKGQPVVVRDVLTLSSGLSWEPLVMWRALREMRDKEEPEQLSVMALECLTSCEVCASLLRFSI